jgi:iron complex outermembrane recepter protein
VLGKKRICTSQKRLMIGTSMAALMSVLCTAAAQAQEMETVVVTGYRASLESALVAKRTSVELIDQINAEDMGKFPETNLADSMARLPGVNVDRGDTGEARTITVRGLGPDFTLVRINGMDALSTAGGTNAQTQSNRSRGFDFNTFASELFSALKVQKSASASSEEGSLGAIVDLTTGRPLSYDGFKWQVSGQEQMIDSNNSIRPRASALIADQFFGNTLGIMGSISYSEKGSTNDFYARNFGSAEYVYRNSQLAGVTPNTYGFARPTNDPACLAGVVMGCGSDPAAYASLSPTTLFPTFPMLSHSTLNYHRLGTTLTGQWKPSNRFEVVVDYLYSEYGQRAVNYQLHPISTNRNLYNNTAATNPASLTATAKRNLYPTCATISYYCQSSTSGITPAASTVSGMLYSTNANNLDPYDYYNNAASPGYVADANGLGFFNELIGRPNMQLKAAHTTTVNGKTYADYLALDNVDWRNDADGAVNKTIFRQWDANATYSVTDQLRVEGFYGESSSMLNQDGTLVEFNAVDMDGFVYDETGHGNMPEIQTGFDVANPANWQIIKGLSSWRHFVQQTYNSFKTARIDVVYDLTDTMSIHVGADRRIYKNATNQAQRLATDTILPTLQEANLSQTDLGQLVSFGSGLSLPGSTPTGWFAPNIQLFDDAFGVNCNCINKWSDWRLLPDQRANNSVVEKDFSYYVEFAFNENLAGHNVIGNVGVRVAQTSINASGYLGAGSNGAGTPITAHNSYHDILPSFNFGYEIIPDLMLRVAGAKVMARPQLSSLTAGTTSFSTSLPTSGNPSITKGNPFLKPFRSNNLDASVEWYFSRDGLFSVAVFQKQVSSFPQQLLSTSTLANAFGGSGSTTYAAVLAGITNTALQDYTSAGGQWDVRQYQDAPGGQIEGLEITFQSALTFLPEPFDGFGVTANFTHLSSKLSYVVNGDTRELRTAPWLNNSPNALNGTLYYEKGGFQARVAATYRAGYNAQFPLSGGTCEFGLTTNAGAACNSPIMADFRMVESDLRFDASTSYDVTDNIKVSFEAQNITGETTRATIYQDYKLAQRYEYAGRVFMLGVSIKN